MSATLLDISKKSGFSVSTVSRVLHGSSSKSKISKATSEVIRNIAREMGYHPNLLAQSLRLSRTRDIGIIVTDIGNPFFATMVKSIAREVRSRGYSLIVCDSDEDTLLEKAAVNLLLSKKVAGLIIAPVGIESAHLRQLQEEGGLFVTVDRCFDELDIDSVSVDNTRGSYLAVSHLIGMGHKKIAFIQGLEGTAVNTARLAGYRKAMAESGLPYDPHLVVGDDFRARNGYLQTKLLVKRKIRPTAIFASSDLIALGALEALKEERIHVPQEVSIASFDDPGFATFLSPALTAVEQPVEKMGELAAALLFRHLAEPETPAKKILLDPQLQIRESVARI